MEEPDAKQHKRTFCSNKSDGCDDHDGSISCESDDSDDDGDDDGDVNRSTSVQQLQELCRVLVGVYRSRFTIIRKLEGRMKRCMTHEEKEYLNKLLFKKAQQEVLQGNKKQQIAQVHFSI